MPWRIALLVPVVVALVALAVFVPYLRREREVVVATPQPPPLFLATSIVLGPGQRACAAPVPLSRDADVARIVSALAPGTPAPALRVDVTAPGYAAGRTFAVYRPDAALELPLPDPPAAVDGWLCVRNLGGSRAQLAAAREERTLGRLRTTVRGRPYDANLQVSLLASRPASLWQRRAAILRGAAAIGPSFAPAWLLWTLALLVVVGVPALVAGALRFAPPGRDQP